MAIYKAGNQIGKLYKGSNQIGKVYKGSTLIYTAEEKVSDPFGSGTSNNYGGGLNTSKSSATFNCVVGDTINFTCVQHLEANNAGFNAEINIGIGGGYRIYNGSTVVKTENRDVQFNGTQTYNDKTWNVSYPVTSAGTYKVEVYAFTGEKSDNTIYASSYTNITSSIIVS